MTQIQRRFMKRLKHVRALKNLSQAALAEKAGLSREYLARLETGRQDPTLGTMAKLAKALNVKPSSLID
jgi:transcriptional regulator with XRE-family HTH domain